MGELELPGGRTYKLAVTSEKFWAGVDDVFADISSEELDEMGRVTPRFETIISDADLTPDDIETVARAVRFFMESTTFDEMAMKHLVALSHLRDAWKDRNR